MKSVAAVAVLLVLSLRAAGSEGIAWRPLGEPGCGGWVTSLAVSLHDSRRVLVGGDLLGVGLSADRGESWRPARGFRSWEIGDFTWHPTDPNTVWVGTMSGPYVSADAGLTWQERRKGFPPVSDGCYSAPVEKVLFDPADADRLLAFGGSSRRYPSPGSPLWGAVWESRDAGQSWARLTTITADGSSADPKATGRNVVGAAFAAGSSQRLYAAVDGAGVFVSIDAGRSWKPSNAGLPHTSIERVTAHPKDPDVAWACLNRATPKDKLPMPGGVYKTTDGGKTWQPVMAGLSQRQNKEANFTAAYKGFAVSRGNPDVMYTSDLAYDADAIYRSPDGGATWQPVATRHKPGPAEADPVRKAVGQAQRIETAYFAGCGLTVITVDPSDPNAVFAAGAEYILRSLDGGKTWLDVSSRRAENDAWRGRGYSGLCCISFRFHPTKPGMAALLAMDAGKFWLSRDDMKSWTFRGQKPWPWGGGNDATFAGDYLYATFGQFGSFDGILRTTNGEDWTTLVGEENGLPKFQARAQPVGIYAPPR